MFRIEAFVEDKNLAKVMHSLNGLALNLSVLPVVNAENKNGKLVAKNDGTVFEAFIDFVKEMKLTELKAKDVKPFVERSGRGSTGYLLKLGVERGFLKKRGKGTSMTYHVIS